MRPKRGVGYHSEPLAPGLTNIPGDRWDAGVGNEPESGAFGTSPYYLPPVLEEDA